MLPADANSPARIGDRFHLNPSCFRLTVLLAAALALISAPSQAQDKSPAQSSESRWELPATDEGLPGVGPIRRYDWFRNLWKQRRRAWAEQSERDRGAVIMLGDSITQGWGDDFSAWFPGLKVANRGISGDTSRGVLIRLQDDVLPVQPRAVVLLIGTNDLEEKAEPDTIVTNLKLILAEFAKSKTPVLLCQVFPSSASKSRPADKIKRVNQLLAEAVKGMTEVTFLETWPLFANPQGDARAEVFPDLLHLNMAGYVKWAAALRPVLATLGLLETEPYDFTPEPGFVSLFNGKDLTGWEFPPTSEADKAAARRWLDGDPKAPPWPVVETAIRFDGRTESNDGRFVARNGRLIVTTPTEGRKIQQLATAREFAKDFVLRLEFRATPNADSGIFIRGRQLQCRDYPLAGPYKNLRHYRPGEWNEMEITVRNGEAHCLCNGEVIESAMKVPASGPIGFEGDRGQLEYRRIRIREEP